MHIIKKKLSSILSKVFANICEMDKGTDKVKTIRSLSLYWWGTNDINKGKAYLLNLPQYGETPTNQRLIHNLPHNNIQFVGGFWVKLQPIL